MIERLRTEMSRAKGKHRDCEWARYSILRMFTRAILPELWEAAKAAWRGDLYGRHGVVEEMIQTAGVLLRAAAELERRKEVAQNG